VRKDQDILRNILLGGCEGGIQLVEVSMFPEKEKKDLTVAGMIKEADATAINEDIVEATVELKSCSMPSEVPVLVLWIPPAKKQHPSTRSILERILPNILDWTILISPFLSATILTYKWLAESFILKCRHTISSTALPNVAFNNPPIV
jgi:hypothetical protein